MNMVVRIMSLCPAAYLAYALINTEELNIIAGVALVSAILLALQPYEVILLDDKTAAELKEKIKEKSDIEALKIIRTDLCVGIKTAKEALEILR